MEQCRKYVTEILDYVHAHKQDVPEKIYKNTRDLAVTVATKMRAFGDAMAGKINSNYVSMQIQHFKLVDNLRRNQPDKYKQLCFFATIYPTLDYDDQQVQLEKFMMTL